VPLVAPVLALLQAMQVAQLALAQQTPSTQEPVAHSVPAAHVCPLLLTHLLLVQVEPAAQVTPQAPQFGLAVSATQAPPQRVAPAEQVGLQTLAAQEVVPAVGAVHLMPQPPQLLTSLVVVTQTPLQLT
jgi:hypothetical protein